MCPFRGAKALLPSTSQGFLPAVDLSDGGPFTASRGSCPGADAKFSPGSWLKILWPVHLTLDRWNGGGGGGGGGGGEAVN